MSNRKSSIDKIQKQIDYLGSKVSYNATRFMAVRLLTTITMVFLLYYLTDFNYLLIPFIAIIYYFLLYYIMIAYPVNVRSKRLERDALSFFELLTLSLEAGKNLEHAIEITVENQDSELSREFRQTLKETKYGKSLVEALKDMRKRIPSEAINNVLLSLTEAMVFGSSLIDNMKDQIDFLKDKDSLAIKEQINKIPNKISIISVLCMVPLMLLIILGPILIEFIG